MIFSSIKKIKYYFLFIIRDRLCSWQEKEVEEVVLHWRAKEMKSLEEFKRHALSTEIISDYKINLNNTPFIEQSLNTMAGVQVEKEPNWKDKEL